MVAVTKTLKVSPFSQNRLLISLALTLLTFAFLWQPTSATGTINEFKLQATNMDQLGQHARNCTTVLDSSIAVTFCEDGYMIIHDSDEFISPHDTTVKKANITLDNKGSPKDLRLGKFLSMVDPRGEKLTIIRKSDLKSHGIYLDTSVGGEPPVLLGGQFTADFVLFYISYAGTKFIQLHESNTELKLVGVLDGQILNYEVLDLISTKGLFYLFAIQTNDTDTRSLQMMQYWYNPTNAEWKEPALAQFELDRMQCGDTLAVSYSVVVLSCWTTRTITIYRRRTMTPIYQKTFTKDRFYGEELHIMDKLDGQQVFVFYTISKNLVQAMGMFEVLINESLPDNQQLIIDYGELAVPVGHESTNFGPLNIGGGGNYLLTYFDKFSIIKGYTMCSYLQTVPSIGSTECVNLQLGYFNLDPWSNSTYACGDSVTNANQKSKLDFICNVEKFEADTFFIVVIVVVSIGITCCCISNILFCKFRQSTAQLDTMNVQQDINAPIDPQIEARLIEQENQKKLTLLKKKLTRMQWKSSKHKDNQDSCVICVEDFNPTTMVRETPCKHIFHEDCLMRWVETKLATPDCPYCRTEINFT